MLDGGVAAETVSVSVAVCVRLPEVPVKLTVDVATAALDDAVSVVLCAVPGVRVSVAGLAVTPVGRPVMATVTGAVSPLDGLALTLTAVPVPPAVRLSVVGASVSVKFGPGATVSVNVAEWTCFPEVPEKVSVALPAAADELAVMVTFCGVPGVRLKVEGLAVTPAGSPLMLMATVPVNLLTALAVTLTVEPAAPAVRLRDAGETAKVKSGVAAAAAMVSVTLAEWLRVPEVPVKVSVALPAAAEDAAVRVTC